MIPSRVGGLWLPILLGGFLLAGFAPPAGHAAPEVAAASPSSANASAVTNLTGALGRLVTIVGAAGGALLALVWARVAISWFSNDITKKVQAKDRARDALIGTLLFVGAVSGLVWALAQWVVTGT